MTESSSGPSSDSSSDSATTQDAGPSSGPTAPDSVELDIDEEKVEDWDRVKGDYEIEPDDKPVPNSMDAPDVRPVEKEDDAHLDA